MNVLLQEISNDLGGSFGGWNLNRHETTMKIDLWCESYDLNQPQHIASLRNLINALMKSVGERGEFRIELGGAPHYGTYTVTKPGETVEVRVTPLKKRLRKSLNTAKPHRPASITARATHEEC
jgi:hypothetical protein